MGKIPENYFQKFTLFTLKHIAWIFLLAPLLTLNAAFASETTSLSQSRDSRSTFTSTSQEVPTLKVPTIPSLTPPAPVFTNWQEAENETDEVALESEEVDSDEIQLDSTPLLEIIPDPKYRIPPTTIPNERVDPFTTTLYIDQNRISHLTEWEFTTGTVFSENTESDLRFNAIAKLDSEIVESLTVDNILVVAQTGTYLKLGTIEGYEREVRTTFAEPHTITGARLQASLTGTCIFPDTEPTQQCTFTPGLVLDESNINPNTLLPTGISQTSQVGDVVTPESLAAMRLPGFQAGANGQQLGLDLFYPQIGRTFGNAQSNQTHISRKEELTNAYTGTLSRVHQIVKANENSAVLGRTVYGFTILSEEENFISNFGLQMAANILPIVDPKIKPGEGNYNPNINRNLFLAPNNVRLPAKSFTIYHGGVASAPSISPEITSLSEVPNAEFNSIWFGFSPVVKRSLTAGLGRFAITGPRRVILIGGQEASTDDIANTDFSFSAITGQDDLTITSLRDFHTQIYLTFSQQDADLVRTNIFQEETKLYPHLSATGDITGTDDLLRYYSGVIFAPEIKAYLGGDYTQRLSPSWNFTAGGIGYINPDRDYYSQVWGNTSKRFSFNPQTNLVLSTGFNYAIDRDMRISDIVSTSQASRLTVGANLNSGNFSVGLLNYFGGVIPNSFDDTLIVNVAIRVSDELRLSGFVSPINKNNNRARYGASASWKLDNRYNSPSLSLNWTHNEYDFGNNPFGNNQMLRDNVFTILFRMGSPGNPFDPTTAQRLRRESRENNQPRENLGEDSADDLRNFPSPEAQ